MQHCNVPSGLQNDSNQIIYIVYFKVACRLHLFVWADWSQNLNWSDFSAIALAGRSGHVIRGVNPSALDLPCVFNYTL